MRAEGEEHGKEEPQGASHVAVPKPLSHRGEFAEGEEQVDQAAQVASHHPRSSNITAGQGADDEAMAQARNEFEGG